MHLYHKNAELTHSINPIGMEFAPTTLFKSRGPGRLPIARASMSPVCLPKYGR